MKSKLKNIYFLLKGSFKINKKTIFITIIKNFFRASISFINIIGIGVIIDSLETKQPEKYTFKIIGLYVVVSLSVVIIREFIQLMENNLNRKVSNKMQFEYSEDAISINYHFVQDNTLLNLRRKSMRGHPAAAFIDHIGNFFYYIFQLIGIFSIFSILSPLFIIIILLTSLLSIILIFIDKKNNYDFINEKIEEDRKLDYLYSVMTDYRYAKEIRINNAKDYIGTKYNKIFNIQTKKIKNLFSKNLKINLLSTLITITQTIIMYFYFTYSVFTNKISISEYTVLLASTTLLISLLLGIFDTFATLNDTAKSFDFYKEYKSLVQLNSVINDSNKLPEVRLDLSNYTIKFEKVSFSYPGDDSFSLKNINLEIKKNDRIGIVGLNGSGKTTFIKLLIRLYDPTEGIISINGIDIKTIPYQQYIKNIGIVLQDFSIFAYSVKENIIFDSEYDASKLDEAIIKSGLEEKIKSLKKGIDTSIFKILDKEGIEFSGGEEQKLALARAIYKDGSILVLDEPTSAMDPLAEYEFFSKISNISKEKTTIFISHRLSSTKNCDIIFVFSNGEIVEKGNHHELMNQQGIYYNLFNLQAKYYTTKENKNNE